MKLSSVASGLEVSLTRQLFNKAKAFSDVIDLTLGDPDLVPSIKIRDAACAAIQQGKTRYSVNAGLLEARLAIGKCIENEYKIKIDCSSEIMLTIGGMGALYISLMALVDAGDEVLVIAPYYVNYVQMVRMCGGVPVIINTDPENNFAIDIDALEKKVSGKTVAIIINSPCNPSGTVIDGKTLDKLAEFVRLHNIAVISDEVYRTLIYDNKHHESIFTRPDMKGRTIMIDSMSKRFAMTGYRCGFAVGPENVISAMTKMQENIASCTPLPSQYAAIKAYDECCHDNWIKDEFEKRRDYIWNAINGIPLLSCNKPDATFYLFVNIKETGMDSVAFAHSLLEAQHVAVVPGVTYGDAYNHYIRIAYTMDIEILKQAVTRIAKFISIIKEN